VSIKLSHMVLLCCCRCLQQFFLVFDDYQKNDFYITGEVRFILLPPHTNNNSSTITDQGLSFIVTCMKVFCFSLMQENMCRLWPTRYTRQIQVLSSRLTWKELLLVMGCVTLLMYVHFAIYNFCVYRHCITYHMYKHANSLLHIGILQTVVIMRFYTL